jgi:hypothetical protein
MPTGMYWMTWLLAAVRELELAESGQPGSRRRRARSSRGRRRRTAPCVSARAPSRARKVEATVRVIYALQVAVMDVARRMSRKGRSSA